MKEVGVSERTACMLVGVSVNGFRYKSRRKDDTVVRDRMKELAGKKRRWGYRTICSRIRLEGYVVNHKRLYRMYSQEGLTLRRKRRRKRKAEARVTY